MRHDHAARGCHHRWGGTSAQLFLSLFGRFLILLTASLIVAGCQVYSLGSLYSVTGLALRYMIVEGGGFFLVCIGLIDFLSVIFLTG